MFVTWEELRSLVSKDVAKNPKLELFLKSYDEVEAKYRALNELNSPDSLVEDIKSHKFDVHATIAASIIRVMEGSKSTGEITHLCGEALTARERLILKIEYGLSLVDLGDNEEQSYLLQMLRTSIHSETGRLLREALGHLVNGPVKGRHLHPVQTGYDKFGRACVFKIFSSEQEAKHERDVLAALHKPNACPFLAVALSVIAVDQGRSGRYAVVLPNYGTSVGPWIQKKALPGDMLPAICLSLGCALLASHTAGYAFVDLKPDHVIFAAGGCVLVDAGSATPLGEPIFSASVTSAYCLDQNLGSASASFDLICLASTLYHIVTGSQPPASVQGLRLACRSRGSGWLRAVEAALTSTDSLDFICRVFKQFENQLSRDELASQVEFISNRMSLFVGSFTGVPFDAALIVLEYCGIFSFTFND